MQKKVVAAIVGMTATAAIAISGCGAGYSAAHDHNAPTATNNAKSGTDTWHWIDSPGNFQTLIYECIGTEGIWETQDNSYPILIIPQDPICGYKGTIYLRPAGH
jgi:hypothetical protein